MSADLYIIIVYLSKDIHNVRICYVEIGILQGKSDHILFGIFIKSPKNLDFRGLQVIAVIKKADR